MRERAGRAVRHGRGAAEHRERGEVLAVARDDLRQRLGDTAIVGRRGGADGDAEQHLLEVEREAGRAVERAQRACRERVRVVVVDRRRAVEQRRQQAVVVLLLASDCANQVGGVAAVDRLRRVDPARQPVDGDALGDAHDAHVREIGDGRIGERRRCGHPEHGEHARARSNACACEQRAPTDSDLTHPTISRA